jgi:UDP-GlcNAc3NAcA epimerase
MKLLSIVGARPQFVKAATINRAILEHNKNAHPAQRITHRLLHTGQHYERSMSGLFFEELPLPDPDHNLGVGSATQGKQTAAMIEGIERVLLEEQPDLTLVYGDTNSTLAGAIAAAKLHLRVAHLEAGLRSFNRRMPEELNRVVTDHLADILLCPTPTAVANLRREGIRDNVFLTGDVMLDAIQSFAPRPRVPPLVRALELQPHDYLLLTIHRAENTANLENLRWLAEMLAALKYPTIFPMHPRVRDMLEKNTAAQACREAIRAATRVNVIAPVSYSEMIALEANARAVLTDSGGVQKEAYFLGVPCLTLRNETEWLETLAHGWNRVVGTDIEKIISYVNQLYAAKPMRLPPRDLSCFGDGKAAAATVRCLVAATQIRKPHISRHKKAS